MIRIFFLSLSVLMVMAMPALARDKVLDIKEVSSTGGLKAWLVEDHSIPIIAFQFAFKGAGAALDPLDKQGLSRMASNTMDEGAGDLDSPAFQKILRDLVNDLHFSSSRDDFGGAVKTLTKNKTKAFELLTLALTKPRFDADAVGRMREANQSRIRSAMTEPDWIAARLQNDVAFAGHAYAQNSGGTLSSLDKISPEDLKEFVKKLSRDKLVISASGDITPEELSALMDQVLANCRRRRKFCLLPMSRFKMRAA